MRFVDLMLCLLRQKMYLVLQYSNKLLLICKVLSVLGYEVCWPYAVFATIENVYCIFLCLERQKMQVDRKCHILNKLSQIKFTLQMCFQLIFKVITKYMKMNGFLEKYFHKMIFQITRYYDEPNRVLALFFSPFILFLSVMLFSILLVH